MSNIIGIDEKFIAITDSICYWLGYQFKIGRGQLLHEASLRYPVADTITSKDVSINNVVLEQLHPIFKSKKIDLVIYEKDVQKYEPDPLNNVIKEVYEFKLAKIDTNKEGGDEHQRVFDDVVRLAYFHLFDKKDCYFLMCGKFSDFKAFFIRQNENVIVDNGVRTIVQQKKLSPSDIGKLLKFEEWDSKGLYSDWFSFKIGEEKVKKFEVKNRADTNEWGLNNFQQNYIIRDPKINSFSDSITIKTKCLAITPNDIGGNRTYAAGIWKIEAN